VAVLPAAEKDHRDGVFEGEILEDSATTDCCCQLVGDFRSWKKWRGKRA